MGRCHHLNTKNKHQSTNQTLCQNFKDSLHYLLQRNNDQLTKKVEFYFCKKKEKYLCADAQLLMFQSSPSRIKILSILSFASTEVGKRKACILFCRFKQELIVFVLMAMEIREVIKFINLISVPQKYSPKGWINTELTAFMLGSMTALPCTCKLFKWERDLSDLHSLARIL